MRVLTVNAGSSSLKLAVIEGDGADPAAGVEVSCRELGRPDAAETNAALGQFARSAGRLDATAHRLVHGGPTLHQPAIVDAGVRRTIDGLRELAPLHIPPALAALDAVTAAVGASVPAVACFDTAFHATLPTAASTYALPAAWAARWGLRRYGFHGLSHQWAAQRAADLLGRPLPHLRLVTCHLGSGSSLAAVEGGRSVDTTMGFTPVEGLVMATRPGSVDPGLLVWLLRTGRVCLDELDDAVEHGGGLQGLTGQHDMREVLDRAAAGDAEAASALGVHDHRLRAAIAAMAAAMGGVDGIVWTGGIGEHAPAVRQAACGGLAWLGVELDHPANDAARGDAVISAPGSAIAVAVVTAREDLMLAAGARQALGPP